MLAQATEAATVGDAPMTLSAMYMAAAIEKRDVDAAGTGTAAAVAKLGARSVQVDASVEGTRGEVTALLVIGDTLAADASLNQDLLEEKSPTWAQLTVMQREMVAPPLSSTTSAPVVPAAVDLGTLASAKLTVNLGPGGVEILTNSVAGAARRLLGEANLPPVAVRSLAELVYEPVVAFWRAGAMSTTGAGETTVEGDRVTTEYDSLSLVAVPELR